ncbi:MAG: hypothetical protein V4772_11680 [Pseudomonadota bacterium]
MVRAQQRIVSPLDHEEQIQLGVLLGKLVAGHEKAEGSRFGLGEKKGA